MTVATGYRPRPWEHHLRLAAALARAPARVGIDHADDGWVAAHIAVCGRAPVWSCHADPRPVQRALVRLGLPGLVTGTAEARIGWDLSLKGSARPCRVPVSSPTAVDVVTTVSGPWQRVRDPVRTLQGQGRLILVDRSGDPATAALLDRVPRARVLRRPGASEVEALAAGLDEVEQKQVLIVPEGMLLLPGALAVLHHALGRAPGAGAAVGDLLLLDRAGTQPQGLAPAPRLPETRGLDILGAVARPVLLHAELLCPPECAESPTAWMRRVVGDRPVRVAPVWTAGRLGTPTQARAPRTRPGLALVSPDVSVCLIVDDGDDGALAETLQAVPPGARTVILRAVMDGVEGVSPGQHTFVGGFRDLHEIDPTGPWSLRLTSDPTWAPPALVDPSLLARLDLPLPSAVVAVAAALGWALPVRRRPGGRDRLHPTARLAVDARTALDQGDRRLAFTLGRALQGTTPEWAASARFLDQVEERLAG